MGRDPRRAPQLDDPAKINLTKRTLQTGHSMKQPMNEKHRGRRQFLRDSALLGTGLLFSNKLFSATATTATAQPQEKNPAVISRVDGRKLSPDELVFVASLQGVVAKTSPRIYLDVANYSFWIPAIEKCGCRFEDATLDQLRRRYLKEAAGYVLAGMNNISVAATVAGPLKAVVLTETMQKRIAADDANDDAGGLKMLMDARDKTEEWLLDYVKAHGPDFSYNGILQHIPARPHTLVDLAIADNKLCIVGKEKPKLVDAFYSLIEPNTPRLGWGNPYHNELHDVSLGSKHGLFTLAAANALNLSLFSKIQPPDIQPFRQPANTPDPDRKNVHHVMLMMSDGSNLSWIMGPFITGDRFIGSPRAPGIKMNWMFPPITRELAPAIFDYYREHLPRDNYLLGAPSSAGYTYPSLHKDLPQFAATTNRMLRAAGLDIGVVIDTGDFRTKEKDVLKTMLQQMPDVKGLYYMAYDGYTKWGGDYYKINGKPVISLRHRLWPPKYPLETIAEQINKASRNVNSPDAYSAVVVHAWSYTMDDVARFVKLLKDDVVLVNAAEFMELMSKNVKTKNY